VNRSEGVDPRRRRESCGLRPGTAVSWQEPGGKHARGEAKCSAPPWCTGAICLQGECLSCLTASSKFHRSAIRYSVCG
jgi:hypothetical protein